MSHQLSTVYVVIKYFASRLCEPDHVISIHRYRQNAEVEVERLRKLSHPNPDVRYIVAERPLQ